MKAWTALKGFFAKSDQVTKEQWLRKIIDDALISGNGLKFQVFAALLEVGARLQTMIIVAGSTTTWRCIFCLMGLRVG